MLPLPSHTNYPKDLYNLLGSRVNRHTNYCCSAISITILSYDVLPLLKSSRLKNGNAVSVLFKVRAVN